MGTCAALKCVPHPLIHINALNFFPPCQPTKYTVINTRNSDTILRLSSSFPHMYVSPLTDVLPDNLVLRLC